MSDNDTTLHILSKILQFYYEEYPTLREDNQDLGNLDFHHRFGMRLSVPESWPVLETLKSIVSQEKLDPLIVYSSTQVYRRVYSHFFSFSAQKMPGSSTKALDEDKTFFISWHEIYSAMQRAQSDMRFLRQINATLQNAGLVIVIDAAAYMSDVIDHIRVNTNGCLIIFD